MTPKEARVLVDYAKRRIRRKRKVSVDKNEILIRYALMHIDYMRNLEAIQSKDKRIAELERQVAAFRPKDANPDEQKEPNEQRAQAV